MDGYTKLPKKNLMMILISSSVIILMCSIEVMIMTKDMGIYQSWLQTISDQVQGLSDAEVFSAYLTVQLSRYFLKVIVPVMVSVHSYYSYVKLRINKLFVFVWVVLTGGEIAYHLSAVNLQSVIFYISLFSYLFLIFSILSLNAVIDNERNTQKVG